MELDQLIDELEDVLAEGRRVPFSGRLLIEEDRILDIIDRMRVAVPEEVKQARRVMDERDRLMGEAQSRVQLMLDEQGLTDALDAERHRLLSAAERDAQATRDGADEYARQVLEGLEEHLGRMLSSIQKGLKELRNA